MLKCLWEVSKEMDKFLFAWGEQDERGTEMSSARTQRRLVEQWHEQENMNKASHCLTEEERNLLQLVIFNPRKH